MYLWVLLTTKQCSRQHEYGFGVILVYMPYLGRIGKHTISLVKQMKKQRKQYIVIGSRILRRVIGLENLILQKILSPTWIWT